MEYLEYEERCVKQRQAAIAHYTSPSATFILSRADLKDGFYLRHLITGIAEFIEDQGFFCMSAKEKAKYENPAFADDVAERTERNWRFSTINEVLRQIISIHRK